MNTNHARKIVWVFVAIGALSIFTISLVAYVSNHQGNTTKNSVSAGQNAAPTQTKVTEVDKNAAPNFFPADLPSESGANIVKNYNTTTPDGRVIGTRVYVTAKSVDDNYTTFQSYFKNAGWEVTAAPATKGTTSKTLLASKDNMQAQVTIGDDAVAKAKTVAIIMTQYPKK